MSGTYPIMREIADIGILVEFGDRIDDAVHSRVLKFDAALSASMPVGVTELVPAYTSVLVNYDPLLTDPNTLYPQLKACLQTEAVQRPNAQHWRIPVCYEEKYAPDLPELSEHLELSPEAVVDQHISGNYKVYMYGFAPGCAYLGGVPSDIQYPRKAAPVMDVPAGAVMIAGPQGLITTVKMPTGWWVIGQSSILPLSDDEDRPFLFGVGDSLEFVRMSETDFLKNAETL